MVDKLLKKLYQGQKLQKQETIDLLECMLSSGDESRHQQLFDYAREIREQYYGKDVYMRGLIEFSNICKRQCMYCGLRSDNREVVRYRLSDEEILACCEKGYQLGFRTFVLQSGEDPWYTSDKMVDIITGIKKKYPDTALTLSIGERTYDEYLAMYDAGADRFLLRHETASERLYRELHPDMKLSNRQQCLYDLKAIGYQVGAGFMVGLPGQQIEDLAEDLHFLQELEPDMIGIGPFIPHSQTPLGESIGGSVDTTLVMIAITRLFVPRSLMPATTALGSLHPQGRERALRAGANIVMPNLTPVIQKANYSLYENKICLDDDAEHCRYCIAGKIRASGYQVNMGIGHHCKMVFS